MGRGPVDFKFSAGWERRALTEIKLMSNSGLIRGASKQITQYLRSEKITCGFYVCVGFYDHEFEKDRLEEVRDNCAALEQRHGFKVMPVFVDARRDNKPSASKQK